jgi:hypothetical protein
MTVTNARERVIATVSTWYGVSAHPHRFGGTEFRLGRREIGHIHGDRLIDIPFPTTVRNEVVASGEADPHHILPDSGWVSFYIRDEADVEKGIALLRRSFELAARQRTKKVSPLGT